MRITPKPLEIGDEEGFTDEKDIFQRRKLGKGLTNLVTNVTEPLVLAVDGQWGSGKTIFLKMWAGELRKKKFPVIYFDAFEHDYTGDAFTALAGEIVSLVETKKAKSKTKNLLKKTKEVGKVLGRSAGKLAVQAATMGALRATDLEDMSTSIAKEASALTDKHLGELLENRTKDKETIDNFRSELSKLPTLLSEKNNDSESFPLVFIIDELDRCRPCFALDLLERIKHFFNVPNVHFVLGVHMGQLENSVKAAYGSDIKARLYLQKFMHLTAQLADESEHEHERVIRKYCNYLPTALEIEPKKMMAAREAMDSVCLIGELENYSLRTLERIASAVSVSLAATTAENTLNRGHLIGGLCILKTLHPKEFKKAKEGKLQFSDVESTLRLKDFNSQTKQKVWLYELWHVFTHRGAPQELKDQFISMLPKAISSFTEFVPHLANKVVDRFDISGTEA